MPYPCRRALVSPAAASITTTVAFGPGLCLFRGGEGSIASLQAATARACDARAFSLDDHAAADTARAMRRAQRRGLFASQWHEFTVLTRSASGKDLGVGGNVVSVDVVPVTTSKAVGGGGDATTPAKPLTHVSDNGDGTYTVRCVSYLLWYSLCFVVPCSTVVLTFL